MPIGKNLKTLAMNLYFWAVLVLRTVTCVHGTLVGTDLPYSCKYLPGNDSWMYSMLYLAEAWASKSAPESPAPSSQS